MPGTEDRSVLGLAAALGAGKTTSRALVEEALANIADRATFISLAPDARDVADAQDRLRRAGYAASPLAGLPVSVKDLFDIAGERTLAGSKALDDRPPAARDAAIVQRLKAAGAVIVGRTNMTEFAYSGVGINPHYGTPGNPYDRARIPGGSSSGAAVSAKDGSSVVAIGTDTGGSVRIPAALCGLVGFKPTARRVPTTGAFPLSTTLDSVGPLARTVACCAIADAVLAGEPPEVPPPRDVAGLRLAVPQAVVLGGLDDAVSASFARALSALSRAGAQVTDLAARGAVGLRPDQRDRRLLPARGVRLPPRASGAPRRRIRPARQAPHRGRARHERGRLRDARFANAGVSSPASTPQPRASTRSFGRPCRSWRRR